MGLRWSQLSVLATRDCPSLVLTLTHCHCHAAHAVHTRTHFQAKTEALQNMENANIDKRAAMLRHKQTKEELNRLMTASVSYEMERYWHPLLIFQWPTPMQMHVCSGTA